MVHDGQVGYVRRESCRCVREVWGGGSAARLGAACMPTLLGACMLLGASQALRLLMAHNVCTALSLLSLPAGLAAWALYTQLRLH